MTERLQAAIAKARQQRDGPRAGQTVRAPAGDPPVPEGSAWDSLPVVASDQSVLRKNRILSLEGGTGATPFDMMRTRVLQRMRENGWRRVAITSPSPGCGKSTLLLNLAFGMSRQPDRRIIAIETDMRRPSHERLMGIERGNRSVARILGGQESFGAAAFRPRENLAMAVNSRHVENASDVILSGKVGPILSQIDTEFAPDITLFDMPPLLANDDTQAFLTHVDCTILVAAAGETTVKEIDQCERMIAQTTQMMGVVLNKSRYAADGSYDYY